MHYSSEHREEVLFFSEEYRFLCFLQESLWKLSIFLARIHLGCIMILLS